MWCDGEREAQLSRVRAGHVTDDDIAAMVVAYTPATPAPPVADDAPVVIDLTDRAEVYPTRRRPA